MRRSTKNTGLVGSMDRVDDASMASRQRALGKLIPVELEMIYASADPA